MSRLQHQLLSLYTRWLSRPGRAVRTNVGFGQATHMGILYGGRSDEDHAAVRSLADRLEALGKRVTVLCCATPPNVGLWGKIHDAEARAFVSTPFDYLYQLDWEGQPVLDYLLAKSRAKCRVGHYTAARTGLFEVMVTLDPQTTGQDMTALADQMLHYSQLLQAT